MLILLKLKRGKTMKFTKNVCALLDDDLDQICGGIEAEETAGFLIGLIAGPIMGIISNFTTPFAIYNNPTDSDKKALNAGILISNTITQLGILYLGYRGLKAIFSKNSPSCNSKDDKKLGLPTPNQKAKEQ